MPWKPLLRRRGRGAVSQGKVRRLAKLYAPPPQRDATACLKRVLEQAAPTGCFFERVTLSLHVPSVQWAESISSTSTPLCNTKRLTSNSREQRGVALAVPTFPPRGPARLAEHALAPGAPEDPGRAQGCFARAAHRGSAALPLSRAMAGGGAAAAAPRVRRPLASWRCAPARGRPTAPPAPSSTSPSAAAAHMA